MPFAFISMPSSELARFTQEKHHQLSPPELLKELNGNIRKSVGAIAVLGGCIVAPGIIPKTRSGKTLRRVLRQLLENGIKGDYDGKVEVPATVEDASVVDRAREVVKEYFTEGAGKAVKAKL